MASSAPNITGSGIVSGSVLIDDFDRANSTTVGNGWNEVETGSAFAQITGSDYLSLDDLNPVYVHQAISGYDNTLTNNTNIVTWYVSASWGTTLDGAFGASQDNWAYVIAASDTNFESAGNGYAIVGSFPAGTVALVRYTGGLKGTLTSITTQSSSSAAGSITIRVDFDPTDDTWDLNTSPYSSNQLTNLDADPRALSAGTDNVTDATYTGTALANMGFYWQGSSTTSSRLARFNNFYYGFPTFGTGWSGSFTSLSGTAPTFACDAYCAITVPGACLINTLTGADEVGGSCIELSSTGSISGQVWHDVDGDGIQETGDNGFFEAFVLLYDSNGNLISRALTDASGNYSFTGLPAGEYTVSFANPDTGVYNSMSPSNVDGSTEETDSDATANLDNSTGLLGGGTISGIVLGAGESVTHQDAGFNDEGEGSISGFVFEDVGLDGSSSGDSNLDSVSVSLYTGTGTLLATVLTDESGYYFFGGLTADADGEDYYVVFSDADGTFTYTYTTDNNPSSPNTSTSDSDAADDNATNQSILGATATLTLSTANPRQVFINGGLHSPVVPIELASLSIKEINCEAEISWLTLSEENNDYFEIQRSLDGRNFETISTIQGAGNSLEPIAYNFIDKEINKNAFYRLVWIDFFGNAEYSEVQYIKMNHCNTSDYIINIYPNPIQSDILSIDVFLDNKKDIEYTIQNTLGKTLINNQVSLEEGTQTFTVNLEQLSSGTYFIIINNNDSYNLQTHKFIKQ